MAEFSSMQVTNAKADDFMCYQESPTNARNV